MQVPADESKYGSEKYVELWTTLKDITRLKTNNSYDYDERYMKIKFNSDDLHLKKMLKLRNMIIVRAAFYEENKYYLQVFLDQC